MAKNKPAEYIGESVSDLIDDAAQLLHGMAGGLYFDAQRRTVLIEKSKGKTIMTLTSDEMKFIVTCIEDQGRGKIESITLQGPSGKMDLYRTSWAMTYNFCIMGEQGKTIMRRMIDKLKYCTPQKIDTDRQATTGAQIIHLDTRRKAGNIVAEVTNLAAAFERRD